MGSCLDLRKFQSGKDSNAIADAFGKIVSGGKMGYKTVIEKRKVPPKCEKCGRGGDAEQKFCPQCGGKMVTPLTNCPKCEKDIGDNEVFCTECGTKLR